MFAVAGAYMHSESNGAISFSLALRDLMMSGSTAVILHLYRDGKLAATSTLTVCDRQAAVRVLRDCVSHLRTKLGIREEGGTAPRLPAVRMPAPALPELAES